MKKDYLTTKVNSLKNSVSTKHDTGVKELEILKQKVSDLNVTNEILDALLDIVQHLEKKYVAGEELEINVFKVFNYHNNDIRYTFYKDEVKRTLEAECNWIVLDTEKNVFRIKLPILRLF